jgi:uncharacterized protein (DUF1800 family)
MKTKITRRDLFAKVIGKANEPQDFSDPLFKKYSRKKLSEQRVYQSSDADLTSKDSNVLNRITPVTSGLQSYTGAWTTKEVLHLLNRTGFGFNKKEVDLLSAMTIDEAVAKILSIDPTPSAPPLNTTVYTTTDTNYVSYGGDWTKSVIKRPMPGDVGNNGGNIANDRERSLIAWLTGLACNQDVTIKEKMNLFWYHFIPINIPNAPLANGFAAPRLSYAYMKMFRDNTTGNFKNIIKKMAKEPAMMYYLNNNDNSKNAPDENFAREIMELFTLGKDPASQYTQEDVVQAAKVLTGWRVQGRDTPDPVTRFVPALHDTSNKQFSAFFNNTVIQNGGESEIDTFIDMIFSKSKVVSEYICRRLYRFFVYYDIDATTETNVIVPLAETFVQNNWEILPVLTQLFKSKHFFDVANRGVFIKSPMDLVIGSFRIFNLKNKVADQTNYEAQYNLWLSINNILAGLGQGIGDVPTVSGWIPFYQNPSFYQYWINSSSTQKRYTFLNSIFNGYTKFGTRIEVDVVEFVKQFNNTIIEDPNLLVLECIKYLLPIDLSQVKRDSIKNATLLSGQTSDYYWSDAWTNYLNAPTNAGYLSIVKTRLKALLTTISQFAEHQLM